MNTLCQAVDDYLELRRGLGFKLVNYGAWLREFVSFLEQEKTSHITTALALQFAMLHPKQEPKAQAGRYTAVRGFASYRSGIDPATEIPPCGLVRGHTRRARPYLFTLIKKSANCWKPRGSFPRRIVCGLGPIIACSVCWQ
jgi:integrase/recombinase XerD